MCESRSDPDSKQKTETELSFWIVLPAIILFEPLPSKTETETGLYSQTHFG